jgi:cytochrome c2
VIYPPVGIEILRMCVSYGESIKPPWMGPKLYTVINMSAMGRAEGSADDGCYSEAYEADGGVPFRAD